MTKIWKFFEFAYLIIAVIFIVETILQWNENRNKAYLLLLFSMVAVGMYFFRKKFRKKIEKRNKE